MKTKFKEIFFMHKCEKNLKTEQLYRKLDTQNFKHKFFKNSLSVKG